MTLSIKRAYEPADEADGQRILVDRFWPRGIRKADARIDAWARDIAPSAELCKWFGHDPEKWTEFQQKYRAELKNNPAFAELKKRVNGQATTLVYGARDEAHNNAVVLRQVLSRRTLRRLGAEDNARP